MVVALPVEQVKMIDVSSRQNLLSLVSAVPMKLVIIRLEDELAVLRPHSHTAQDQYRLFKGRSEQ